MSKQKWHTYCILEGHFQFYLDKVMVGSSLGVVWETWGGLWGGFGEPRWLKMEPRWSNMGPRWSQDGPCRSQEAIQKKQEERSKKRKGRSNAKEAREKEEPTRKEKTKNLCIKNSRSTSSAGAIFHICCIMFNV